MEFTIANKSDIQKYYLHTFVKFRPHAIEKQLHPDTLFYIEHVDSQKVSGKCENGEPFIIWLSDTHPFDADYVLPHKSLFQHGPYAILLERIPAQQYFRGLHPENTQMTYLSGASPTPKSIAPNFENLKSYVTKQSFFTLLSAIAAEGCQTCVLTPRMQYNRNTRVIYIDHLAVAKVDQHHKIIRMLRNIFREEVEDMLKAAGELNVFTLYNKQATEDKQVEVSL